MSTTKVNYSMIEGSPIVSVKDFGALGDGTGKTPADTGVDITNASWNCYPAGSSYFDPSYTPDASITSSTKAFTNTDSWDSIGIQLAVWYSNSVHIPIGEYVLTKSIQKVRGMEGTVYGASSLQTKITYKNYATFSSRPQSGDSLFNYYRVAGGPPSYIRDLGFSSTPGSIQGTGLQMNNCNQVHLYDLWISGFNRGISQDNQCTDGPFCTGIVTEFNNYAFFSDDCDPPYFYDCDFWQSAGGGLTYQAINVNLGAHTPGDVFVSNTRFVGFRGNAVFAAGAANIVGCEVVDHLGDIPFSVGDNSIVSSNAISGTFGYAGISVGTDSIVNNNTVNPSASSEHADIKVNGSTCVITGNRIIKTNTTANADNYAILIAAGTNTIVSNNILSGGSRAIVAQTSGTANIFGNMQNGVLDGIISGTTSSIANGATINIATVANQTSYNITVLANTNTTAFFTGAVHVDGTGACVIGTISNGGGLTVTSTVANTLKITGVLTTQSYTWKITKIS